VHRVVSAWGLGNSCSWIQQLVPFERERMYPMASFDFVPEADTTLY
jgi:hypothetical protein